MQCRSAPHARAGRCTARSSLFRSWLVVRVRHGPGHPHGQVGYLGPACFPRKKRQALGLARPVHLVVPKLRLFKFQQRPDRTSWRAEGPLFLFSPPGLERSWNGEKEALPLSPPPYLKLRFMHRNAAHNHYAICSAISHLLPCQLGSREC